MTEEEKAIEAEINKIVDSVRYKESWKAHTITAGAFFEVHTNICVLNNMSEEQAKLRIIQLYDMYLQGMEDGYPKLGVMQ